MAHAIKRNSKQTFSQQCYEQLKHDIINGVLKPGQKIKLAPLKQRFGIGQSPIREALSKLVAMGLVTFTDNKGFTVAVVSEADVRDVYATFTLIESAALKLSIERGDAAWEALVVSEFHKLELLETHKEPLSCDVWSSQNYIYHRALLSACGSPSLLELQSNLYLKMDRYCRLAYQMDPECSSANHDEEKRRDHKRLKEAALARNVKTALKIMEYHINAPLEDVIKVLKKKNLI